MVTIDGTKYACERCIRGHRVSGCNHLDKPLTMIKKKGRPATHCPHCRKGKGGRLALGNGAFCSCSETRRERTVITPKDLEVLQQDPSLRIELSDGSVVGVSDAKYQKNYGAGSPLQDSPTRSSTMLRSPHTVPSSSVAFADSIKTERDSEPSDLMDRALAPPQLDFESASSSSHRSSASESSAYGRNDDYASEPAFRYETGFFGQPYNADLYNSAIGNNAAAAQANSGGESAAAIANVALGENRRHDPRFQKFNDHGPGRLMSLSHHHPLLSTSSQDLEASIKALSPLADPRLDIDRDELVGGILRAPAKEDKKDATEAPVNPNSREDQDQDPYSSVQPMPKLSSLY